MSPKRMLKILPLRWRRKLREHAVALSVQHLHRPKSVHLAPDEAVVTCVVKNGEFSAEQFIRHYTQMGFRHIFFLDNGSTDRTISIATKHERMSASADPLFRSRPIRVYLSDTWRNVPG